MGDSEYPPHELTDLAVRKFASAGIDDAERDRWLAAGFGPYAALNHLEVGATLDDATLARRVGLGSRDLRELAAAGRTIEEYVRHAKEAVHLELAQLRVLHERGFRLGAITRARRAGFELDDLMVHTPEVIIRFQPLFELGLSREDVLGWASTALDIRHEFGGCRFDDDDEPAGAAAVPRFPDVVGALLAELGIDVGGLLSVLAAGNSVDVLCDALRAGATVELLLASRLGESPDESAEVQHLGLVAVLRRGVAAEVITGWIEHGLSVPAVSAAVLKGAPIDDVPWRCLFPDDQHREQWRATGLDAFEAARWLRFGLVPDQVHGGAPVEAARTQVGLLSRLRGVGLDGTSDDPCEIQGESAEDGLITVVHRELRDGYLSGRTTQRTMHLAELLQVAAERQVRDFVFKGLSADDAITLLNCSPFRQVALQIIESLHDPDEPYIVVNGTEVALVEGSLVPHDRRRAPALRAELVSYPPARSGELGGISEWEVDDESLSSYRSYWSLSYEGEHGPEWETLYLEVNHSEYWDGDVSEHRTPDDELRAMAWEWSVSVSEDTFEAGFAASLAEAIADCERAALDLGEVEHG